VNILIKLRLCSLLFTQYKTTWLVSNTAIKTIEGIRLSGQGLRRIHTESITRNTGNQAYLKRKPETGRNRENSPGYGQRSLCEDCRWSYAGLEAVTGFCVKPPLVLTSDQVQSTKTVAIFHNSSAQFLRLRGILILVSSIVVLRYMSISHCLKKF